MFENYRSRVCFDNCAVRTTVNLPTPTRYGRVMCAKYPEGFRVSDYDFKYSSNRSELATKLGCLACPYRKLELPVGDLASEAIIKISTQNAANELDRLTAPTLDQIAPPTPEE